ncbi:MAG TPA: hypothetical protein VLV55_01520 [Rhizomicrobium sp.]|nr:hypothetical protein [Rhizomicrobium sp.]
MNFEPCGPVNSANTIGEMLQTLAILRGEITIPPELRALCRIPPTMAPVPPETGFSHLDAALVELSTPIEYVFRGFALNHNRVRTIIHTPIRNVGPEAAKLLGKWIYALREGKDEARERTSAELVNYVPENVANRELVRAVVREMRSNRSDVVSGLERICDILGCPVGVILYFFRYMPDGRPVDWPPGFVNEVVEGARRLNLPTFDPTPTLLEFGVEKAFREDQEFHYVHPLLPIMGEQMIRFAESICKRGAADRSPRANEPIPA